MSEVDDASSYSQFSSRFYETNGSVAGKKTGLGAALKVMAGDMVKLRVESYFNPPPYAINNTSYNMTITELLTAMINSGAVAGIKGIMSPGDVNAIPTNSTNLNDIISRTSVATIPKAYLNYILFDDQMKYVTSGAEQVGTGGYKPHLDFINSPINVTKSGFLYVYVSNESNVPVYFDNLNITHTQGPILEETHYYPFGLTMAGISSEAAGDIEVRYKYNGKELQSNEFSDGRGLELYDYEARIQDPQLGRFWSSDPLAEKNHFSSPYSYVDNNPILRIDPDGRDWIISMREVEGKIVFDITLNGKVYNNSSNAYSKDDMEKFKNQMAFQIRSTFGQDNENLQVNVDVNLSVASSIDDIKKTDHVFQIVDDGKVLGGVADAPLGGLNVRIEKTLADEIIGGGKNTRTAPHEVGHTGGLDHPHGKTFGSDNTNSKWYADVQTSQRGQNLMSQSWYVSQSGNPLGNARQITKDQYEYMYHQYTGGNLNQNSPVKSKWVLVSSGLPILIPVKVKYLENKTQ